MNDSKSHIVPVGPTFGAAVICISGLNKSFGAKVVLKNFSIDLRKGENLVVLGRSGSGKSVLIKCVIGLVTPDSGVIYVLGENIAELNHEDLDKVRSRVGFLFQSNGP